MSQSLATLPRPDLSLALADYDRDPLGFLARCAQEFGEIVPLQIGEEQYCLLSHPDQISAVLKDRIRFIKAEDIQILRGLIGNGLVTSEGDFWQRQRRLIQPMFLQQRMAGYGEIVVTYTQRFLDNWQSGQQVNLQADMLRLTLDIVMKTIFDRDLGDADTAKVAHALEAAMTWYTQQAGSRATANPTLSLILQSLAKVLPIAKQLNPSERRYQAALDQLDQTLYAMIAQRRQAVSQGEDLLSLLIQVEDADDGSRMSDQQLRDEVATMMMAGHETTASTLTWTWMLLAQHPTVLAKLTAELQQVLQGRRVSVADLPQLPYTHQVIKEAMRLYPPVTDVSRKVTEDCEIGGYHIPKDTTLIMSQWVMHRHPRYFPEPEAFQPERWVNDLEKQLPRGVYFPFGDGPRVCIGKGFALMEAALILVTMAQHWQLSLLPNQVIELQPSITLRPKQGIQMWVQAA